MAMLLIAAMPYIRYMPFFDVMPLRRCLLIERDDVYAYAISPCRLLLLAPLLI